MCEPANNPVLVKVGLKLNNTFTDPNTRAKTIHSSTLSTHTN
jgi:hypothetical protein